MLTDSLFGVVAMELYVPKPFIDQADFERAKGISAGKVTKGLGQEQMAFVSELEDVNSMALTVLKNLLTRTCTKPGSIGKLEFATETLHDKSKSTKTVLMKLLGENRDVEGVTNINACYGGTAALFNCLSWLRTDSRGRMAVVVMADVAVYDTVAAQPTGGAGAIALLLGPNPMVTLGPLRTSHFADEYDFYKPRLEREYPVVNGHYSIKLYVSVLLDTFAALKRQHLKERGRPLTLLDFDYFCFHCPFIRQAEKGFLQLFYQEILAGNYLPSDQKELLSLMSERPKFEEAQTQRTLREMLAVEMRDRMTPGFGLSRQIGNIYTGSLYLSFMSLIKANSDRELQERRVMMYSFGSGVSASLFDLTFTPAFRKDSFLGGDAVNRMLDTRKRFSVPEFDDLNYKREAVYNSHHINNQPAADLLRLDTYYLRSVDAHGKRTYQLFLGPDASSDFLRPESTAKFRQMGLDERIGFLNQQTGLSIKNEYQDGGLNFKMADLMVENCVGALKIPIGMALNFVIDHKKRLIPMVTEEPSVIAAASNAAKIVAENSDGFHTVTSGNIVRGQVFLERVEDSAALATGIETEKPRLIKDLNAGAARSMASRGGGVVDIRLGARPNGVFAVDVLVDVQNAMGANTVNTILEALKPELTKLVSCQVVMAIVSNLPPERTVKAHFEIPTVCLAVPGMSGEEVARKILVANDIARHDVFRATTHNKGVMNGIDAIAQAVGQDVRAIEASCHAYTTHKDGRYGPLTRYYLSHDGSILRGEIEIPFLVGTVGGVTRSNKLYQLNLRLLGNPDAKELGSILASVGLAQNLAALRKLVTEGIQHGHMRLHAKNIAVGLGIDPARVPEAVEFMMRTGMVTHEAAREYLKSISSPN
jgi:hydroxymethylglutaryl-CoA synthase